MDFERYTKSKFIAKLVFPFRNTLLISIIFKYLNEFVHLFGVNWFLIVKIVMIKKINFGLIN